jgi:hypothetical protein
LAYSEVMSREWSDEKESFEGRPGGDIGIMEESKRKSAECH